LRQLGIVSPLAEAVIEAEGLEGFNCWEISTPKTTRTGATVFTHTAEAGLKCYQAHGDTPAAALTAAVAKAKAAQEVAK